MLFILNLLLFIKCLKSNDLENGLYGYGADSGSGTYFENTIVVQYDPQVQEVWDQARKLRCTWHDQYEKSVTFRYNSCFLLEYLCISVIKL